MSNHHPLASLPARCVASKEYRSELKAAFAERAVAEGFGEAERVELHTEKWERLPRSLIEAESGRIADATRERKFAAWKVKVARELRVRPTVTNAWIVDHLAMGRPTRVGNLIQKKMEVVGLILSAIPIPGNRLP